MKRSVLAILSVGLLLLSQACSGQSTLPDLRTASALNSSYKTEQTSDPLRSMLNCSGGADTCTTYGGGGGDGTGGTLGGGNTFPCRVTLILRRAPRRACGGSGSPLPGPVGGRFPGMASRFLTLLQNNGIATEAVPSSSVNQLISSMYDGAVDSFTGDVLEFTASSASNVVLNGAAQVSATNASTLTANTLVRFSTSAIGAQSGSWWTTVSALSNGSGGAMSPTEIQQAFALPSTPTYMSVGGNFPNGSTVYAGEAAANAFGSGGGFQLFSENLAEAESAAVAVGEGLAAVDQFLAANPVVPFARSRTTR